MNKAPNLCDIETRIIFLEDQNEGLNSEIHHLRQDNERLRKELKSLARLIKPLLKQTVLSEEPENNAPPPHY